MKSQTVYLLFALGAGVLLAPRVLLIRDEVLEWRARRRGRRLIERRLERIRAESVLEVLGRAPAWPRPGDAEGSVIDVAHVGSPEVWAAVRGLKATGPVRIVGTFGDGFERDRDPGDERGA